MLPIPGCLFAGRFLEYVVHVPPPVLVYMVHVPPPVQDVLTATVNAALIPGTLSDANTVLVTLIRV